LRKFTIITICLRKEKFEYNYTVVRLSKLGWLIIGVTFGIMDIWSDNLLVSFIFGWSFGKLFFSDVDKNESDKD
jgi:hypothetical protein